MPPIRPTQRAASIVKAVCSSRVFRVWLKATLAALNYLPPANRAEPLFNRIDKDIYFPPILAAQIIQKTFATPRVAANPVAVFR